MDFQSFKKYWPAIAILIIIILSIYVRTIDYRWPYLRNIDSYTFYRQMDEIVANGGVMPSFDNLMLAPDGAPRKVELFPYQYLGAYSYMFVRIFADIQLWQWLIYLPAILASLMAIPMYYIGKILYDRRAGVLAAFFVVFDISNISRTLGGDPDSDAIVLLFPLIVMAVFLFTYKYIEKEKLNKKAILFSIITGILLGLWGHIWVGYWYVIWLITGMIILKFLIDYMRTKNLRQEWQNIKHIIYSYIIMIVIMSLILVPFFGLSKIANAFTGPIEFQDIKKDTSIIGGEATNFPNVYVSVAELQESGGIKDIILRTTTLQGPLLFISPFFLMIYALIYLLYSYYKKKQHLDTAILLLIWFLGPLLATIIAVRFTVLFSAPMAIGSAIILTKLWRMARGEDEKFED
jgi:asparagine N-glycosylation enzyme membrane subunit Stt3